MRSRRPPPGRTLPIGARECAFRSGVAPWVERDRCATGNDALVFPIPSAPVGQGRTARSPGQGGGSGQGQVSINLHSPACADSTCRAASQVPRSRSPGPSPPCPGSCI